MSACRFLLLGLLIVCSVVLPPADCAPEPQLASRPPESSIFGINGLTAIHMRQQPQVWEASRKRLAQLADLGAAYDRVELWWGVVQPKKDRWDFSFADKLLELYAASSVRPMVILSYSSAWSASPPSTDEERKAFGEYVFRMVSRYKDKVKHWEVWNEPNIPTFWPHPDAALYSQLLKVAYARAKEADPKCVVIAGSTSGPDVGFLKGIAASGAWASCDAISIHPYSMAGGPEQQRLPEILDIVQAAIAETREPKPLWITEIGWTSSNNREELEQAAYLAQTYVLSLLGGVTRVFWFKLDDFEEKWGIISGDGKPRKSYYVYKTLSQHLANPQYVGPLMLADNVRANLFMCGGRSIAIVWSMDGKPATVTVPLDASSTVADASGASVKTSASGAFEVGLLPVLVIDPAPEARNLAARSRKRRQPDLYRPNLVVNPGFEDGHGDAVSAWNRGNFDSSAVAGRFSTGAGRTGSRSAAIAAATDAAWDNIPIPVRHGQRYRLTAWCKATGTSGLAQASIHWYSGTMWGWLGSNSSEQVALDGKWQLLTAEGTAPDKAVFARVRLTARDLPGEVLFDDVALTLAPPSK